MPKNNKKPAVAESAPAEQLPAEQVQAEQAQTAAPAPKRRRKADPETPQASRQTRGRRAARAATASPQETSSPAGAAEKAPAPESPPQTAGAAAARPTRGAKKTDQAEQADAGETGGKRARSASQTRRPRPSAETLTVETGAPPDAVAEAQAGAPSGVPIEGQALRMPDVTLAPEIVIPQDPSPQLSPAPATPAEAAAVSAETGVAVRPKRGRGKKAREERPLPSAEALGEKVKLTPPPQEVAAPEEQPTPARRGRGKNTRAAVAAVTEAPQPAPQPETSAEKPKRGRRTKTAPFAEAPAQDTGAQDTAAQETEPHESAPQQAAVQESLQTPGDQESAVQESAEPEETAQPTDDAGVRELLLSVFGRLGRPLHVRDLERQLTRRDREKLGDRRDLGALLEGFVHSGDLVRTRKRTYGLPQAMNLVRGRFQASSGGFGFVIPDAGGDDYYIPPESTLEAWNGDIVLVRAEGQPRRGESPRATVVRVVERKLRRLVGTLEHSKGYAILKSDDTRARHRVLLMPEGTLNVPSGSRVVAELFWPEDTGEDEVFGRVTRVLGETDDPETETQAVIVKFDLREDFPPQVMAEAEAISTQVPESALSGRLDLRELHIFTVDGRDAKDFDDAIHIQGLDNGNFMVGVHIADVSHYVTGGSALDEEAYARATSVYLPGKVLPMLPERLSNGVCSLVPNEDRLTLSAMIEVNADGDVQNVQLAPSVIRSQARLTYDEVQAYSEGVARMPEHARKIEGDLHLLLKLTSRMRQKRLREGSLDFKLREVKVDVDKEGNLQLIPIREETARGMIEDLMLLANKVVARHMLEHHIPALYRVHEEPTLGRFQEVSAALARMGIVLGEEPTPQAYQAALKKVRGTPQETVVNTLLLRSLKQARYMGENLGHFGLAFEEYLHFTSPIRRYPDLIVHRALRADLEGETRSRAMDELRAELPKMGDHTSERERAAAEAERDLTKYYQAKWAQAHLGESFEGVVSGVTSFGLFVALDNGVEGLLHISNLDDDYYFFLEDALMLKGRSTGRTYRMGDPVAVTVAQVNPLGRQIDFSQETDMTENSVKARARKRGEREQARASEREVGATERSPRPQNAPEGASVRGDSARSDSARNDSARNDTARGRENGASREHAGRPSQRGGAGERLAPPPRSANGGGGNGARRRIVTLDRPRNEHNRPIAVTVQRMYFGDWSVDNLRDDDGGGEGGGRRGNGQGSAPRGAQPRPQQAQALGQPTPTVGAANGDANRRRRRRRGRKNGGPGES